MTVFQDTLFHLLFLVCFKCLHLNVFERYHRKSCFKKIFNESYGKLLKEIDECTPKDNL